MLARAFQWYLMQSRVLKWSVLPTREPSIPSSSSYSFQSSLASTHRDLPPSLPYCNSHRIFFSQTPYAFPTLHESSCVFPTPSALLPPIASRALRKPDMLVSAGQILSSPSKGAVLCMCCVLSRKSVACCFPVVVRRTAGFISTELLSSSVPVCA